MDNKTCTQKRYILTKKAENQSEKMQRQKNDSSKQI